MFVGVEVSLTVVVGVVGEVTVVVGEGLGVWIVVDLGVEVSMMGVGVYPSCCACTGLSSPGSCSPHASPQFCHTPVQESPPAVHRLRTYASP